MINNIIIPALMLVKSDVAQLVYSNQSRNNSNWLILANVSLENWLSSIYWIILIVYWTQPPPFVTDSRDGPNISEAEFEEVMGRNRSVSSSAIARAVADASTGNFLPLM